MRRAGWGVWIAYDLPGSYEEVPPNLIDELARDRRWCLGNLMNLRLFRLEGLHPAHRAVFMIGVMAYLSAPLWFLSLALGTALLAQHTLVMPPRTSASRSSSSRTGRSGIRSGRWRSSAARRSCSSCPRCSRSCSSGCAAIGAFGRGVRAAVSVSLETVFSALFAPIRMIFHTQFVVAAASPASPCAGNPRRGTTRRRAGATRCGATASHTLLGIAWTALVWWLDPRVLPWVLPVAGALALSIPLSVFSSRVDLGRLFRRWGLFATPEELHPFEEIARTRELSRAARRARGPDLAEAVIDPRVNALAAASATPRFREWPNRRAPNARRWCSTC